MPPSCRLRSYRTCSCGDEGAALRNAHLPIITLVAGLPPAVHFGLVYIDTILASKAFLGAAYFGVPKLPAPYDTFEWAVVSSFFLVHAVNLGKSNVASWLGEENKWCDARDPSYSRNAERVARAALRRDG